MTVRSKGVEVSVEVRETAREEVEDFFLEAEGEVRVVGKEDDSLAEGLAERAAFLVFDLPFSLHGRYHRKSEG